MNEEYIRQLAKETFEEQISEEIKKHLDSGIIFKYISYIENELQSYKQKEEKIREHCNHYLNDLLIIEVDKIPLQIVLQILNEGDK